MLDSSFNPFVFATHKMRAMILTELGAVVPSEEHLEHEQLLL